MPLLVVLLFKVVPKHSTKVSFIVPKYTARLGRAYEENTLLEELCSSKS